MAIDLLHNPILQGAGLMSGGAMAWQFIRSMPIKIWEGIKGHKRAEVIVMKHDCREYFDAIMQYIYEIEADKIKKTTTNCSWDSQDDILTTDFRPNDNSYVLKLDGKKLYVTFNREEDKKKSEGSPVSASSKSTASKEITTIILHSYFLTREQIQEFLLKFTAKVNSWRTNKVRIWHPESFGWSTTGYTDPRPLSSLIFEEVNIGVELKQDIQEFLNEREWYKEMNIPHRRGYLLFGEPGNGKSSLIRSLASELNMGLAPISLSSMGDQQIMSALSTVPKNVIIVLEDVDAMFVKNSVTQRAKSSVRHKNTTSTNDDELTEEQNDDLSNMMNIGPTFSGLLNALDGIITCENRIIIMTTNHREKLDNALIRPGRCDRHVYIGLPSKKTIARMYTRFFPDDLPEERRKFVNQFEDYSVSMADIQEKLLVIKETKRLVKKDNIIQHDNIKIDITPPKLIEAAA